MLPSIRSSDVDVPKWVRWQSQHPLLVSCSGVLLQSLVVCCESKGIAGEVLGVTSIRLHNIVGLIVWEYGIFPTLSTEPNAETRPAQMIRADAEALAPRLRSFRDSPSREDKWIPVCKFRKSFLSRVCVYSRSHRGTEVDWIEIRHSDRDLESHVSGDRLYENC